MKEIWLLMAGLATLAGAQNARLCPSTELSGERILLTTSVGEMVLGLYPSVAPNHAAQILKLTQANVYDGTAFLRILPGFAAQLGGVARRGPMTGEQVKLITRLKAEFNGCPHRRGTVSMAHDPDDIDSAQTSFLLMFGEIPQMNGRFTVVGEIVAGEEVLDALERVAVNPADNQPIRRTEVVAAKIVDAAQVPAPGVGHSAVIEELPPGFSFAALLMAVAGVVLLSLAWKHRVRRALGMLWVLAGGFGLFAVYVPKAPGNPWLGLGIFAACLAVFRLMTRFEALAHES